MQEQLITILIGLGILTIAYLVDLVSALANISEKSNTEKFSWTKFWTGFKGAILWGVACIGLTAVLNLLAWFTEKLGVKLGSEFEGVSVVALLGLVIGATGSYLLSAFKNIKFYIENRKAPVEVEIEDKVDYDAVADAAYQFATAITPTANEKQTNKLAEKSAEKEKE